MSPPRASASGSEPGESFHRRQPLRRVLVDPGSYTCGNIGDLAMLQTAVARLSAMWPRVSISVLTSAPEALNRFCPDVQPVPRSGRVAFVGDRFLGRAHRLLPFWFGERVGAAEEQLRHRLPRVMAFGIAGKQALAGRPGWTESYTFVEAIRRADLVVASGAGIFADAFASNAMGVMDTLHLAQQWNIPTVVVGQGFGPVAAAALRRRMSDVLPRADLIAVRERRESIRLLESVGVRRDRIVLTGDDAIEMAHRAASPELGRAIGVNLRIASYAAIRPSSIEMLKSVLQRAATRLDTPLLPIPIAHHANVSDAASIRQLVDTGAEIGLPGDTVQPADVIALVATCRVVVTGSYHAAVFALAQGLPVVAVAASPYYQGKFAGVADLFAGGCEVIDLDGHDPRAELDEAIDRAWERAPQSRERLLRAARVQIDCGTAAYARIRTIVDAGGAFRSGGTAPAALEIEPRDDASITYSSLLL